MPHAFLHLSDCIGIVLAADRKGHPNLKENKASSRSQ
jgi:hypothetical protein